MTSHTSGRYLTRDLGPDKITWSIAGPVISSDLSSCFKGPSTLKCVALLPYCINCPPVVRQMPLRRGHGFGACNCKLGLAIANWGLQLQNSEAAPSGRRVGGWSGGGGGGGLAHPTFLRINTYRIKVGFINCIITLIILDGNCHECLSQRPAAVHPVST